MEHPLQTAEAYGYDDPATHLSIRSAEVIVKLLLERLEVRSVCDVGCGVGIWLRELLKQGVQDVVGVDGAWVPADKLLVPRERFVTHDLTTPLGLGRRFDLVLCLEVGEHLPGQAADVLVDSLVAHGSTICFSAAVPGQGGYQHINEQFQDYWIEKFRARGYTAYDMLRPKLWGSSAVEYYYAQNVLVFSTSKLPFPTEFITSPIHPALYRLRSDPKNYSLRQMFKHGPYYVRSIVDYLLHRRSAR